MLKVLLISVMITIVAIRLRAVPTIFDLAIATRRLIIMVDELATLVHSTRPGRFMQDGRLALHYRRLIHGGLALLYDHS